MSHTVLKIIGEAAGFIGIISNILIYQQKNRKSILLNKLTSDLLWLTSYLFVGGYSAACIAGIGVVRETVFLNDDKKFFQGKRWLLLFVFLSLMTAALTWKSYFSLLPTAASLMSVFSFWQQKPSVTRYIAIPISICMLTYDILIPGMSYMGIVNECLTMISIVIAFARHGFHPKAENKESQTL